MSVTYRCYSRRVESRPCCIGSKYRLKLFGHCAAYVLDTHKAPFWTLSASYTFIREAQVARKTMVIGTVSDYPGQGSMRYRRISREALQVADRVVFVGSPSGHVSSIKETIGDFSAHAAQLDKSVAL